MSSLDRRELPVVGLGLERRLVALEPDVADGHLGEQLGHGLEHAEAGAQDRDGDEVAEDPAARRLERGRDVDLRGRQVPDGFDRQHERESLGERAEDGRGGRRVPQLHQQVSGERVVDHRDGHARMVAGCQEARSLARCRFMQAYVGFGFFYFGRSPG